MKFKRAMGPSGPSSAIGIMRFFDTDTAGPKMTPEFVAILVTGFVLVVLAVKFMA